MQQGHLASRLMAHTSFRQEADQGPMKIRSFLPIRDTSVRSQQHGQEKEVKLPRKRLQQVRTQETRYDERQV